jgi:hypothetical protein
LQADKAESDEEARKALAVFSETYWPPLYTLVPRTTFLAFFLSHGGGRETFGLCIAAQRNVEPAWVMPAGYIEPRKIVFHRRRVPHQSCGMNWPQELPEDSQILPRKPSPPSAISKKFLQPQQ